MPEYSVEHYVRDLRAIRSTGAATAETSFYPPIDRLFNAAGDALKPKVLFSTQLRNQGAGMPDGGFFPRPRQSRRNAEPPTLQNPERGVVEIKPATYSLDALAGEPQTLRYLQQYGLVLVTNLREFRLLQQNGSGQASVLERYTLATSADDLWHRSIDPKHSELLPDFLRRVMLYRAPLSDPKDVAWLLASYAREARARAEDHPLASFETVKTALQESLGIQFEGEKATISSAPRLSRPSSTVFSRPGFCGIVPRVSGWGRALTGECRRTICEFPFYANFSMPSPIPAH